ncbi:hypothetical protein Cassandra_0322 [Pseudomonas phage Cassandra]|nr:hypothetical protein Cassandra_0322 [Pseudomonas phage Cassandra]WPK39518.1 hypothetical protein Deiofobo_0321 [Pseudomonas phage Deifobo]WPK40031.1 hypothetical protein ETTORE_0322 [Pseudomonas phage Ettore]WPK40553.1 hypothetical protein Paride_0323 [Pseudomonas phage Paride]
MDEAGTFFLRLHHSLIVSNESRNIDVIYLC